MICRFWRGWTHPEDADAYQALRVDTVTPGIEARRINGFRRIGMMRRNCGEDHETAHVPAAVQAILKRYDARSTHYEIFGLREQS